jgi:hypothetical protein
MGEVVESGMLKWGSDGAEVVAEMDLVVVEDRVCGTMVLALLLYHHPMFDHHKQQQQQQHLF